LQSQFKELKDKHFDGTVSLADMQKNTEMKAVLDEMSTVRIKLAKVNRLLIDSQLI